MLNKIDSQFVENKSNGKSVFDELAEINSMSKVSNFGSKYNIGNESWCPDNATIDNEINQLALVKPRPILLVFHIRKDSNGVLRIVQHGFNTLTHSETKVDYAVNKLIGKGFTIYGIKVHGTGSNTSGYTFDSQYMTNYSTLVNQLATKYQGKAPYFFVTNEFPEVTGSDSHKAALQSIISDVKSKGFKASMSFLDINESIKCKVLDDLDAYGINCYPRIGTKGLTTTDDEVISAWKRSRLLTTFADLKKKYPNKLTFITETGIPDKIASFENPAKWDMPGSTNEGKIMARYWNGTFKALKDFPHVDMIFGWDAETLYSPYQFTISLDTMKKWIGDNV
ncbi:hypothetical protein [Metabacillus sp. Hm71]|uniref:hypothetical protein n=1 Tax=Metabacillus sp. Hm71 TaxID=3450743 RepID=UPI003F42E8AD